MKPSDIKVGSTYTNRGAGKTRRTILAIGRDQRPERFFSDREPPEEDGVLYEQNGKQERIYISSFAGWCGRLAD